MDFMVKVSVKGDIVVSFGVLFRPFVKKINGLRN